MKITHISAECYPAAKAGGLGDVTGSLPKYLNRLGMEASVLMPYYKTTWLSSAETEFIYEGKAPAAGEFIPFRIHRLKDPKLGFELYLVDADGRFDRPGLYIDPWTGHPYWDEKERFFSFQIAALEWLITLDEKPDLIHCHDHHTGLVPFMMKECFRYEAFREIPSVITIHNGEYQGRYDMDSYSFLPAFNLEKLGMLEWDGAMNCLAAGIKSAWMVTTVSKGYMQELLEFCHGLEVLLRAEKDKTTGIVNGIDNEVWDPQHDPLIVENYDVKSAATGKKANKKEICEKFSLDVKKPLISFIGRLVLEKGADLIPDLVQKCYDQDLEASFAILGTGDPVIEKIFREMNSRMPGYFNAKLEYNEQLAHRIYAGSDFLLMPSRVEPCGLNQLYSLRYGTIPIVRKTGGLADTVIDIEKKNGYGIVFGEFSLLEIVKSMNRAVNYYSKKELFKKNREKIMKLDFSWEKSAGKYIEIYRNLQPTKPKK